MNTRHTYPYFLQYFESTVKLGNKERFDKEQIGIKELFMDYQPFYTIDLLLDKELLPVQKMPKLGIKEHEIVKISKKKGTLDYFCQIFGFYTKKSPKIGVSHIL